MPELPEVETIRQDLSKNIINKKIDKLEIGKVKIVKNDIEEFKKELLEKSFSEIERIGKLLIFVLKSSNEKKYLLIHLKMTGQLIYTDKKNTIAGGHSNSREESMRYRLGGLEKNLPNKFSHVIFSFKDGSRLYFNDMRQFGYLKIVGQDELNLIKARYGIEPLQKNFTWKNFENLFFGKKTNIKAFLLKQEVVAGLGNIYVDEILFASGVLPTRAVSSLSKDELKSIFDNTKKIIKKAIKFRGTTFSDFVDASGEKGNFSKFLKVYGKEKQICSKCKRTKIIKTKVAGRGTRICPRCQN